jgi:hypothetical protein
MEIRIWLDELRPPEGHVYRVLPAEHAPCGPEESRAVRFSGWLSLLRALQDLLDPEARTSRRF